LTEVLLTKFSSLITSMAVKDSKKSILRPLIEVINSHKLYKTYSL
jgi:hypothetical protein